MLDNRQFQPMIDDEFIKVLYNENFYSYKENDYRFINAQNFASNAYDFIKENIFENVAPFSKLQEMFFKKTFEKLYNQPETIQHLITSMFLAKQITEQIETKHNFESEFKISKSDFIFAMGIHDVGKMIVPPEYLLKQERLSDDSTEKLMINLHSYYGKDVLKFLWNDIKNELFNNRDNNGMLKKEVFEIIGAKNGESFDEKIDELENGQYQALSSTRGIVEIIKNHHEGKLSNPIQKETFLYTEAIMLSQMIDVLDALVQERCYKKGKPIEEAIEIFNKNVKNEIKFGAKVDLKKIFPKKESDIILSDLRTTGKHILEIIDMKKALENRVEIEDAFMKEFRNELERGEEIIDKVNHSSRDDGAI